MPHLSENDALLLDVQRASERDDWGRVIAGTDELLKRNPVDVDALFLAGVAFLKTGMEGHALQFFNVARQATDVPKKLAAIWNNIGCAQQDYEPANAYTAFKKALSFGVAPRSTYDNLCNVSSQIGKHVEALEWADKSRDEAGFDGAYNRSFALLHLGRWSEGWAEYSKTVGQRPATDRHYGLSRWDGKVPGKVIIHGEQGVGDEILFMSMCPADFDGVIDCNARTADLFRRSFPQAKIYGTLAKNELEWPVTENADWHIEMGGLGEVFAPEPFRRAAFLTADPARKAAWKAWLCSSLREANHSNRFEGAGAQRSGNERGHAPLMVGLAWTGGLWSTGRARRSIPFDQIARIIACNPNVTFVNLEYEDRTAELEHCPQVLNPHWATRKGADLDDLAALVSSLDLVISATNSTIDLSGALGVECWALVDEHPQWRYSAEAGEHVMWFYDSVQTFRQEESGWQRVVSRVIRSLQGRVDKVLAA